MVCRKLFSIKSMHSYEQAYLMVNFLLLQDCTLENLQVFTRIIVESHFAEFACVRR